MVYSRRANSCVAPVSEMQQPPKDSSMTSVGYVPQHIPQPGPQSRRAQPSAALHADSRHDHQRQGDWTQCGGGGGTSVSPSPSSVSSAAGDSERSVRFNAHGQVNLTAAGDEGGSTGRGKSEMAPVVKGLNDAGGGASLSSVDYDRVTQLAVDAAFSEAMHSARETITQSSVSRPSSASSASSTLRPAHGQGEYRSFNPHAHDGGGSGARQSPLAPPSREDRHQLANVCQVSGGIDPGSTVAGGHAGVRGGDGKEGKKKRSKPSGINDLSGGTTHETMSPGLALQIVLGGGSRSIRRDRGSHTHKTHLDSTNCPRSDAQFLQNGSQRSAVVIGGAESRGSTGAEWSSHGLPLSQQNFSRKIPCSGGGGTVDAAPVTVVTQDVAEKRQRRSPSGVGPTYPEPSFPAHGPSSLPISMTSAGLDDSHLRDNGVLYSESVLANDSVDYSRDLTAGGNLQSDGNTALQTGSGREVLYSAGDSFYLAHEPPSLNSPRTQAPISSQFLMPGQSAAFLPNGNQSLGQRAAADGAMSGGGKGGKSSNAIAQKSHAAPLRWGERRI